MIDKPKTLEGKVDAIHDAVGRLETLWGKGPGEWPVCQHHARQLRSMQKIQGWVVHILWTAITGGIVVLWLLDHHALSLNGLGLNHAHQAKPAGTIAIDPRPAKP